jgi:hypothetical protein
MGRRERHQQQANLEEAVAAVDETHAEKKRHRGRRVLGMMALAGTAAAAGKAMQARRHAHEQSPAQDPTLSGTSSL